MTDMEPTDPRLQPERSPASEEWVTLRDASERAGVSVSTLRKWCRSGEVNSRLEIQSRGERRMVRFAEVLEKSDFKNSKNREVEVVLLPASEEVAQTAARQATVEIVPSFDNSFEKPLQQSQQLYDALQQLASAQDRAVRAELHNAFEVERRNTLEERVARLEALHRASPTASSLVEEDSSRSPMDNPDRSAPDTDAVTNTTNDPHAESPQIEAPGVPTWKAIPDTQPTPVGTPKEPPPPDAPVSSLGSGKGYFDPEGLWIPSSKREISASEPPPPHREPPSEESP